MENYAVNKWIATSGSVAYVNNVIPAYEGDYVLRLVNATGSYARCHSVNFGPIPLAIHAFQIWWYKDANLEDYLDVYFENANQQGIDLLGGIRYDATGKWRYYNSVGNVVDIPGATERIDDDTWNFLKIVVDFDKRIYYRLTTTYLDILLSPYNLPLDVHLTGYSPGTAIALIHGSINNNRPIYFDDARIYLNEEE
jgi:hypothetical protein